MPLAKSKNSVGLGNSLMNDRFGKNKGQDMRRAPKGIQRTGADGQTVRRAMSGESERLELIKLTSISLHPSKKPHT